MTTYWYDLLMEAVNEDVSMHDWRWLASDAMYAAGEQVRSALRWWRFAHSPADAEAVDAANRAEKALQDERALRGAA